MVKLRIGDIIGVVHQRPKRRRGGTVQHRAQRAILDPVGGFHFDSGTYHAMRPYVVEYADYDDDYRFLWSTLCGVMQLWVDAQGRCAPPSLGEELTPYCHHCESCEELTERDALVIEHLSRRRKGELNDSYASG